MTHPDRIVADEIMKALTPSHKRNIEMAFLELTNEGRAYDDLVKKLSSMRKLSRS